MLFLCYISYHVSIDIPSLTRAWAEEEAKKAREHARALEEARNQWERQGIKVIVEGGLGDDASAGVTWANAGKEHPVDEAINRAESFLEKLKSMCAKMKVRSCDALERDAACEVLHCKPKAASSRCKALVY